MLPHPDDLHLTELMLSDLGRHAVLGAVVNQVKDSIGRDEADGTDDGVAGLDRSQDKGSPICKSRIRSYESDTCG
jgi:hypothetical protein